MQMSAHVTPVTLPIPPMVPAAVPGTLTDDAFLGGRLQILQPEKGYRAGIDAVFLAAAIPCVDGDKLFEAGIGTGVAALCAIARNPTVHVTGIEVAARHALLCEENAKRNGFTHCLRVIHADVKEAMRKDLAEFPRHGTFNHAFANPPYFDEVKSTPSPYFLKAQAHAFGPEDLETWIKVMYTMVMPRGTVTIVHRAETLGKILGSMESRFGDIRIAPLHARQGAAASRVLVQGVRGSKAPMQLLPGLILHGEASGFTADAEAVLREGSAWRLR